MTREPAETCPKSQKACRLLRIRTLQELLLDPAKERQEWKHRNGQGLLLGRLKRPKPNCRYCGFADGSIPGALPCLVSKGEYFEEGLDLLRPPKELLAVSNWSLVPMTGPSRETENHTENWLLLIDGSSLRQANSLETWHSYYIPQVLVERLPKPNDATEDRALFTFHRNSFVPGPHKNILSSTTVKVISKSILICGKTSKGFMLQVECHYPSKLEMDVSFQFIAFILFTQDSTNFESQTIDIEFLHNYLHINKAYTFKSLRTTKIKSFDGQQKKILLYDNNNSEVCLCKSWIDPETVKSVPLAPAIAIEFSFPNLANQEDGHRPTDSLIISFQGRVTKIVDLKYKIFELDHRFELYAGFYPFYFSTPSLGSKISLFNVHLWMDTSKFNHKPALVACHFSTITVDSFGHPETIDTKKEVQDYEWISRRFACIQQLIYHRDLAEAFDQVLGLQSQERHPKLVRQIYKALNHEFKEIPVPKSSVTVLDFMRHSLDCSIHRPQKAKSLTIVTPKDIHEIIQHYDYKGLNTDSGYGFVKLTQKDLKLSRAFILGRLNGDESGQLKLMDTSRSIFVSLPSSERHVKHRNSLVLIKDFSVIIEVCGYIKLGHYSLKTYVSISQITEDLCWPLDSPIIDNSNPSYLFKVLYKRPVSLDLGPVSSNSLSTIMEGIVYPVHPILNKPSSSEGKNCWLSFQGPCQSAFPFIERFKYYALYGSVTEIWRNEETMVLELLNQESIVEFKDERTIETLEAENIVSLAPEIPLLDIETFVSGYRSFSCEECIFEHLVSVKGRIISKTTTSAAAWRLDVGPSPQELSERFNIGIGLLDRLVVLKIQDLESLTTLNFYLDVRKTEFPLGFVNGSVIQIERMGFQMSKRRNIYGLALPITTCILLNDTKDSPENIKNMDAENSIENVQEAYFFDFPTYSDIRKVVCCLVQVIRLDLKRSYLAHLGSYQVSASALLRLEDGTSEAFGHVDSLDVLLKLLGVTKDESQFFRRTVMEQGDFCVEMDTFDNVKEANREDQDLSLSILNAQKSLRQLCVRACIPRQILVTCKRKSLEEKPRIRHLKLADGDGSVPVLVAPALNVRILSWTPLLDPIDLLHHQKLLSVDL